MPSLVRRLALAGAIGLLASTALAVPAFAEDRWITTYDLSYRPLSVRILPSERVTFVNDDDVPHDAVGNGWSTKMLGYYESDVVTFPRAGTYRFSCSIHPAMRGTIYVGVTGGAGVTDPPTDTLAPATDAPHLGDGGLAGLMAIWAAAVLLVAAALGRRAPRSR